jgi:hypothetical protein
MKEKKPKVTIKEWMGRHKEFVGWWEEHRHSGFCEDKEGLWHWGSPPWEAWQCDRYRMEYASDTGTFYSPRYEYTANEIEGWAQKQKEALEIQKWPQTTEEFRLELVEMIKELTVKFNERTQAVLRNEPELTPKQKQTQLIAQENQYGNSGVPGWEEAKKSYNELKDK